MAEELNHHRYSEKPSIHSVLWNAQKLLLIGLVARFRKNHDRYNPKSDISQSKQDSAYLNDLLQTIISRQQSFYNLIANPGNIEEAILNTSLLVLNQQIFDLLYELHFRLLDFSVEKIIPIIRHIDHQLSFWDTEHLKWQNTGYVESGLTDALNEMMLIRDMAFQIQ